VILADEAAAHVDDETESKISLAFARAAGQGRTVLSVAHRCVQRSCGAVGRRRLCRTTRFNGDVSGLSPWHCAIGYVPRAAKHRQFISC
jgi:hypothetical protein